MVLGRVEKAHLFWNNTRTTRDEIQIEFFVNFFLQTKIFFRNEKNEHLQNLSDYNLKFFIS